MASTALFADRGSDEKIEEGSVFAPRFDRDGLIAAIVTDADGHDVLMFAFMNADALKATIETGVAHFWSRSRKTLWRKGEISGHEMTVAEMRVDCDQDAVWLAVRVAASGAACHTGRRSCFYRSVAIGPGASAATLSPVDADRLFDPDSAYRS